MTSTNNTGEEILHVIANADRFNRWMYQAIRPFVKGNTLEIGSGIGNLSAFFLNDGTTISLSDAEKNYVEILHKKFYGFKNLHSIFTIDLENPAFETTHFDLKEQFDTIFLLNVLEHIDNDKQALQNIRFLLKPEGTIIILTPAYKFLYSALDRSLGHYRRYTSGQLIRLVTESGYESQKKFYFNFLGVFAWLYGKLFRLKTIPPRNMGFYNKLVPVAKTLDGITFKKAGLSIIIVAKKNNQLK